MLDGDRDIEKDARRREACSEACRGISTEAIERIATLPVTERPAALAEVAARQAKKLNRA